MVVATELGGNDWEDGKSDKNIERRGAGKVGVGVGHKPRYPKSKPELPRPDPETPDHGLCATKSGSRLTKFLVNNIHSYVFKLIYHKNIFCN